MGDPELLKYLAPLGVGGILAWGMFMVYRKDMRDIVKRLEDSNSLLVSVVKENTAAITTWIEMERWK